MARRNDGVRRTVRAVEVAQEVLPGTSIELLQALHLLTREGDLNADARRKLKQVNHLIGLLRPSVDAALAAHEDPVLVDCGSGKSYLGLLLDQLVFTPAGRGRVVALEARPELAAAAASRAEALGLTRFRSVAGPIEAASVEGPVHLVTALHACDTATDDALILAARAGAEHVAVVPCCQAEVARQLGEARPEDGVIASLAAHPMHRREFGSHLTNVLRSLTLEALGYRVTVTELVGWEHSMKNELILARRTRPGSDVGRERLREVLTRTGVAPKVVRELGASLGLTTSG
ncbi:MAG: hypothetical protein RLZZ383_944 [Pseudomonadota bacterium]